MYILFYYCPNMLKVLILAIAIVLALATYIAHPILAGGDMVRGTDDNVSNTGVNQNTYTDFDGVCPFGVCPPESTE